jgi:serine/threonine protein kinase/GTPase SAR1 family protein
VEYSLDLNKVYSKESHAEFWEFSVVDRDPGMPVVHRHWCLHLVDTFTPSLTALNLEGINFGDQGLKEFALVLRDNIGLRKLNLKENNLSVRGITTFLDVIETYNFSLTNMDFDESRKTAFAKAALQHESLDLHVVAGEIMANESDAVIFQTIKKRANRIASFNSKVIKVIEGESDKLELVMHDSKGVMDGQSRSQPYSGGTRAREFRGDRMGLMFSMMSNLTSLTIDRWYPMNVTAGDRKWFDDLPVEEQNLRLIHDTKIPSELWALPNLEELRFYDCYDPLNPQNTFFRSIPPEVTRLAKLKHLVISRCGLETVEEPLDQGVVPGKFTSENLERSILYKLTRLQTLGLPGNNLKRIPETIGYCTSLTRLSVGQNKLEALPDAILLLSNLRELWAADNFIWRVPVSLPKYCPNLEDLRILQQGEDEKKSSLIPGEEKELKALRDQERAASGSKTKFGGVIKYMKQFLADHKTIRLNRYKLVVVGDGAVGKTTTVRSLQQYAAANYKKKKNENILDNVATDGIAIQTLRLPANAKRTPGHIGGNECLNFSCWDFAGQDVYTYSHTFFMTEKSIYLIGFDCKGGDSSAGIERVDYWLQVVRTRFPNAYCIVFGTHIDEVGKEDLKALQKRILTRYKAKAGSSSASPASSIKQSSASSLKHSSSSPSLKDKGKSNSSASLSPTVTTSTKKDLFKVSNIEFISNASGKGLPDLISDIKKFPTFLEKSRKVKKNEDEIPINWLILEERGKAKGANRLVPVVPWSEWQQMATTELNMDEAQLKEATSHWHEAGSLSWFDEDGLRDIVCLRPDFLTDVFSAVISAKTGLSSGILRHDALIQIWKGLPLYLYPHMLTILEKFEILHKLEGGVLEGQAGDLFGSGATTPLLSAADLFAATTSPSVSPAPFVNGVVGTPTPAATVTFANGVVQTGGVTLDFGTAAPAVAPTPISAATGGGMTVAQHGGGGGVNAKNMFSGRSIIPAMLPEQEPPAHELEKHWPDLPKGSATELTRLYTFDFVPNGFFARLLVRLLHSKWRASIWWRWGIVLSKNMAKLFLKYEGRTRTMSLRVRGPNNVAKVGSLIDSISTLIQDWLHQAEITIKIPYVYPDGTAFEFDWADVEKSAQSGQMMVRPPGRPNLPPVRIDNLAPDLALLTNSTRVYTEQELNVGKQLGRGGFAVVLKGTLPTGEAVACKKLIFDKSQEETGETTFSDVFTEFRREVWLMAGLQHPHLVRLLGVCTQPSLMMVLEFMEGGTLHDFVHGDATTPKPNLTLEDKFSLALQVAKGMQFMHSMNPPIIHRDLKSPNILMTFKGGAPIAKIADFGLSRGLQWTSSMSDKAVDNPVWLAPEVMRRQPYNEKADVYSYGVILFEIALQMHFMDDIKFDYQKEDAVKAGKRPPIPSDVDPILASLIQFCWAQEPNQRPSFDQIVECLENKTVIKTAKPSIINYGTGFEDFDQEEVVAEEEKNSLPQAQSRSQLTANLPAPPPLIAPDLNQTSSSSPALLQIPQHTSTSFTPAAAATTTASSQGGPASNSSSPLNSARASGETTTFLAAQRISPGPQQITSTGGTSPTATAATTPLSPIVEEEYSPLPTVEPIASPTPTTARKSGWNFAVPQRDSQKALLNNEANPSSS